MGRHSKKKPTSHFRGIFAAAALGVGALATVGAVTFFSGHAPKEAAPEPTPWGDPNCSSSTSTDAELPDVINIFGQDAVKKDSFSDPINSDWTIPLIRQSHDVINDPGKRKAYFDFLKQFDDLKKQFCAAGGKSPESIDAIIEKIDQRVSAQFKDHPGNIDDFKSPIEMLENHEGSSQDKAAMKEAAAKYVGLSDNRMLVVRTNSQGDASKGADLDVLIVNDAPEGAPPHFVVAAGHQDPGKFAFIDARNQRGAFFTINIPKAG